MFITFADEVDSLERYTTMEVDAPLGHGHRPEEYAIGRTNRATPSDNTSPPSRTTWVPEPPPTPRWPTDYSCERTCTGDPSCTEPQDKESEGDEKTYTDDL